MLTSVLSPLQYASAVYNNGDGVAMDAGYNGRMQFLIVLLGPLGGRGLAVIGGGSTDPSPRTFPQARCDL